MNIDFQEISKFSHDQTVWWDTEGPFKTLHDINPIRLQFINQQVNLSNQRVLDIGCGGGILCEAMAAKGAIVTGLDASKEAISAAQQHALEESKSIDYHCQPIESYQADEFDVICCMELLEHVPQPLDLLQQATRLLKPGGYLFLSTINRTLTAYVCAVIAAEYILKLLPKQTHDYLKFIKPSELASMVRQAGLTMQHLSGIAYHPFKRTATLQNGVAINYIMSCQKPIVSQKSSTSRPNH